MPAHNGSGDEAVLSGRLSCLPQLPSKTVKIYICSNKSEFEAERQTLWSQTLPELYVCCVHYGLDLQFVDVHQGHDLDHVLDSHSFQRHLNKLGQASQHSAGPFFLCLFGSKYGKPPLPIYLDDSEFSHIKNEAFESGKDLKLLEEWYRKDETISPVVYRLVEITEKFPNYYCRDPDKMSLREDDIAEWESVYATLLDLIQYGAKEAFKEGLINQVHHQKQERFFLSAIEQELQRALQKSLKGCICIMRKFEDLDTTDEKAKLFMDFKANCELDTEAQKALQNMKELVSMKLNDKNKHTFCIPWDDEGIVPHSLDSHYEYLEEFNITVVSILKALIEQVAKSAVSHSTIMSHPSDPSREQLCAEILPHLTYCRETGSKFVLDGFESEVKEIKHLLTTGSCMDHFPVVLIGQASCGKSGLLTKLACDLLPEILGKDVLLITRFCHLGTSSTFEHHLKSISRQIKALLDVEIDFFLKDGESLSVSYQNLLQRLSNLSKQLVIIFDNSSVFQYNLSWLLFQLPPRVHIIVSFTEGIDNKTALCPNKGLVNRLNIVYVNPRTAGQATSYIDGKLALDKRFLLVENKNVLFSSSVTDRSLNHLDFISERLKQKLSVSSDLDLTSMFGQSFQESVNIYFENLENKYGVLLVSQIAKYLTLAKSGLTEMEMLDLLSLNNDILFYVYPQEIPNILRFPVSLWIEINSDLDVILIQKFCDNKQVFCWSNSTVYQVVRQRYLGNPRIARDSHKHIAELFLESWIDNKPLINKSRNIHRKDCGNRLIAPQPLLYSETKYNMRRINEMWHHLLHSGEQESFRDYAYCNFEYLLATAHSTSMENLVGNLGNLLCRLLDAEVNLVLEVIKQSLEILREDPLQLANELIGRLRQLKELYPHSIDMLVTQCMQWCDAYCLPLVVPLTAWLPDPRRPLVQCVDVKERMTQILPTPNNQHIICATECDSLYMYHVPSQKLVTTFTGHIGRVECLCLSHSHKFMVTGGDDGTLKMWNLFTAECIKTLSEHDSAVLCVTLSHNDTLLVSGSKDRTVLVYSLTEEKVLHQLREHKNSVTSVTFNSTDSILVTASLDQKMCVWYTEDMSLMNTISDGISSPIICMALSVDNTFLLIGCESGLVHVYSFTTGTEIHQLKGHKGKVSSIAVCNDCVHAVIGCQKGGVYIYNLCTTELSCTLSGCHHSAVTSVQISSNQHLIFSASQNTVCVWNMYKGTSKEISDDNHTSPVTSVAINPLGKLAVSGGKDGVLKLWNLDMSVFMESLSGHDAPVTCLCLVAEEGWVLSGSEDKTVKVWNINMASIITNYQGHKCAIKSLNVLNDNSRVISNDVEKRLQLWVAETGQTLFSYSEPIPLLAISPNSEYMFSQSGQSSVKIWMLKDSSVVQTISHKGEITCVACTLNSEHVVTGSDDMSLKVWESNTGKLTQVLVEHQGAISCVTTTENSCNIISGSHDKNIIVWNLATGSVEHLLQGHKSVITVLKVTTDGSILLSGSRDGTLRVWNLLHGNQLTLFDMHSEVEDLGITFDASNIVVRLANSCYVPLLFFHNTPAAEVKSESQVNIQMMNSLAGDILPLPLKPHLPVIHCISSVFQTRKEINFKRKESRFSVSSMPEIIQYNKASIAMAKIIVEEYKLLQSKLARPLTQRPVIAYKKNKSLKDILVSPIKAPVQTAIMAQERKKEKKQKAKKIQRKETKQEDTRTKSKSGICSIL